MENPLNNNVPEGCSVVQYVGKKCPKNLQCNLCDHLREVEIVLNFVLSYFVNIQVMRSVMFHILNIIWKNMNHAFPGANAKQSISAKPAIANLQGNGIANKDLELQRLLVGKCGVSR